MGPPLKSQSESLGFGRGRRCKRNGTSFGRGPPLQGDFVRRVVPRPAPTRGRGTSMYRSDEIPLQRRPSRCGAPSFGAACRSRDRRSHGPSGGERRGSAGIGRKQAMDGLRSPVGARDGGIRRCARSPHCRGSPRSERTPALFALGRSGIPQSGEGAKENGGHRARRFRFAAVTLRVARPLRACRVWAGRSSWPRAVRGCRSRPR